MLLWRQLSAVAGLGKVVMILRCVQATRKVPRPLMLPFASCCVSQVAAMQRDSSTYLDEPEDAADFECWSSSFR